MKINILQILSSYLQIIDATTPDADGVLETSIRKTQASTKNIPVTSGNGGWLITLYWNSDAGVQFFIRWAGGLGFYLRKREVKVWQSWYRIEMTSMATSSTSSMEEPMTLETQMDMTESL